MNKIIKSCFLALIFFSLIIINSLMHIYAQTETAAITINSDTKSSSESNWSYDSQNKILTLNGYAGGAIVIENIDNLKINLASGSKNKIETSEKKDRYDFSIISENTNLTISGEGELILSYGIYCSGSESNKSSLTFTDKSQTVITYKSYPICANYADVTITDSAQLKCESNSKSAQPLYIREGDLKISNFGIFHIKNESKFKTIICDEISFIDGSELNIECSATTSPLSFGKNININCSPCYSLKISSDNKEISHDEIKSLKGNLTIKRLEKSQLIKDNNTGISVNMDDDNYFEIGTSLFTKYPDENSEEYLNAKKITEQNIDKNKISCIKVVEIHLKDEKQNIISPEHKIKVRIPIDKEIIGQIDIYHIIGNQAEKVDAEIQNNEITFYTDSLSPFAIVINNDNSAEQKNEEEIKVPTDEQSSTSEDDNLIQKDPPKEVTSMPVFLKTENQTRILILYFFITSIISLLTMIISKKLIKIF